MKNSVFALPCVLFLATWSGAAEIDPVTRLAVEIADLEQELALLEDENQVENLQKIFGFYIDKHQWVQAADLFADNATIEVGGSGVYVGRERVLAFLRSLGPAGAQEGILDDHMQLQPVIHVLPDGTAKGRWHHFSQQAQFGVSHHWGAGTYENEYVKDGGVWKISKLHLYSTMRTPVGDGWGKTALPRSQPSTELPPDLPSSVAYENYPAVFVVPFHYDNPVTGNNGAGPTMMGVVTTRSMSGTDITLSSGNREFSFKLDDADAVLDGLEHRVGRLEDRQAVERLQTVYGYYLADKRWDDLAGIFAEDGSIEIAMRGVYRGRPSVRRNLNLYGLQDDFTSEQHNHMQYQTVIDIDEDGQSARLRSRAFSIMGTFGQQGRFMGGTYENIYVKRDGVWMILKDQQINTYFAGSTDGWINLTRSAPPGITASNPPDEPPTLDFQMYPKAFIPPYHYANPVTGRTELE